MNNVNKYYFGGPKKDEMKFYKEYRKKDYIKMIEINKIRPFLHVLWNLNNLYTGLGRKFSEQNIIDFLKNPKVTLPRKALNDHQATIIANIYMKYFGNRNN